MEMLGGALKAGVPMEESPSGETGVVAHKQPTKPKYLLLLDQ